MPTKSNLRNTGAPVAPDVQDLDQMGREALLDLWPLVMGSIVPRQISQGLMRRFLAFELQAKAGGGLTKSDLAKIARLGTRRSRGQAERLALGSRFMREWNGTTHIVERVEAGYLWNRSVHTSLSAIAKAITGAHWSGPRFFGLKTAADADRPNKPAAK